MKVLAHYIYIAPEGTFTEESERLIESRCLYGEFPDVWAEIADHYNGMEFFEEHMDEAIHNLASYGRWYFDDPSSGQNVMMTLINDEDLESVTFKTTI